MPPLWLRFQAPKRAVTNLEEWFLGQAFTVFFWRKQTLTFGDFSWKSGAPRPTPATALAASATWVLLWLVSHWNERKCILSLEYSKKLFLGTIEERSVPINPLTFKGELLKEALNQELCPCPKKSFISLEAKISHHMQWFRLPYGNLDPDPWPFPSGLSGKLDENDRFRIYTLVTWKFSN